MQIMFPFICFDTIPMDLANILLIEWKHKMGPLHRGNQQAVCHALYAEDVPVGLTMASTLITPEIVGGSITRDDAIELSRLCCVRGGLNRVVLRLWREFVFPKLGYKYAISYQDADIHTGNTYRFDGWQRLAFSSSGNDKRSGRKGRNKWIWVYPKFVAKLK